ncbi:GntR family transcriptional regulator [Kitasatospora sp. MAP12-15]|uniref:GntR family transcriptional regulator n=1 Tax=unclassified Kitasatospora TaxID=2633591 RepID=UPI002476F6BC|nr:GntR family transcriptional regulator [Kitasatospora sp. MAP12-44]MDH6107872.1 GntR family transcriptional regulator [Kitasatospora sp. MAP12-44]
MTAARDHRRPGAADRIAQDLREEIDSGRLQPGDRLPLTRELAEKYSVTGETVRQAIIKLKAAGVVRSVQGSGVYVREWRPLVYRPQSEFRRKPPAVDIFTNLLHDEGRDGTQTIEVGVVVPDEAVRQRLQLAPGERVAVRRRTSFVDDMPFATDDSYVPHRIVEGSEWMTPGSVERGTNKVLAELGHELVESLDEIYPRMPRPAELERLALPAGTPMAELISTGHDREGRPIQVTICLLPGDRHVIVYERHRRTEEDGEATK